ncbi:MAG: hypothetical protein A3J30_01015 [Candidatus Wildermuthbacteria bacterium RIFCSPLOWO2_02_FULL_47_9c]|uniref:ECF transporter S component n=2 Tax=Parcubacteria group TaxID=1794811 RepID=A0A837ISY2_9BACT|nr:MAG: hypothetical protein UY25_C0001G0153 [Candidatus Yanofskybacteria bacterium GW2011_GWC1_48_11]KKW03872.1 MAG: hypothetical protein UY38_C0002G0026 [Parcubacteria group bacterium GW2011_GWB1_49_12]KKW08566.1 MAG: hypothetical protein UY45_C0006G0052 [Parcubacteria group bacterium GW2011_GWA1_49_26]KKW14044.1 MAG: hypothetical protein UY53_C0004G0095 [Parcubacteria group bacterium GW2011_GWA2_50_10]OHA61284.1 MAG: hypothetical protein A2109_03410 [Candidatus Wildermuthbacteria bacterium G
MKNIHQYFTKRTVLFIAVFAVVGFAALQIPVTQLAGSQAKFTVFDAFAPITGAFIGSIPGIAAVLLMHTVNFLFHGAQVQDAGTIIRFFPMLFAVLYFARKGRLNIIVPLAAIAVFLAHPIGRQVWYFSLFWTIPIISYFLRDRFLFARALGATFSSHAVGGASWIWAFSLPATVWNSLIPIVIAERLLFALGIAVSYVLLNNLLYALEQKRILRPGLSLDPKYLLPWKLTF